MQKFEIHKISCAFAEEDTTKLQALLTGVHWCMVVVVTVVVIVVIVVAAAPELVQHAHFTKITIHFWMVTKKFY